jgi:glycosyltransferase involved in cell wall biosynthesis
LIDIAVIRSNSTIHDIRVRKIVRSLSKRYSITVLGWDRDGKSLKLEKRHTWDLKLFKISAPYGSPALVLYLPLFWTWILIMLFIHRPRVVHACDLDTVLPSYIYKVIFKKKLIFDVFDRYAMAYIPQKFRRTYSIVNRIEESLGKRADVLITVSSGLLKSFKKKLKDFAIVMNCPEDSFIELEKRQNAVFTLVYTGAIVKNRGLENISAAIKHIDNVLLIIAGRVIDEELLDHLLKLSNIQYKGLLHPDDALLLEAGADALVILYDLRDPINNFSMPNKLFEAMMFGLPMITNVAPVVVKALDCGIIVEYNNINQIREAVLILRDNIGLRKQFGINSRTAFLKKYNWKMMENELYKIYENLLRS